MRISEAFGGGVGAGLLACAAMTLLAGCAPIGPPGAQAKSAECRSLQRQQHAMVAKGQQNTARYRALLDTYYRRCRV